MYLFEYETNINDVNKNILVVFSGQSEGDELNYSEALESEFKKFIVRPEEVFFIYPKYLQTKVSDLFIKDSKCYENIIRFGGNIPVTLISFNVKGAFEAETILGNSSLTEDLACLREEIITAGILNLVKSRQKQVILKAPSGTVFCKPSGKEFDEFIKTSEIAVGYSQNQFVAFCLLSKVPNEREINKIFIDTNSLSSFIESMLFYWCKFNNLDCKPATYQSFSSYEGVSTSKPDFTDDIWVIISASSSNSLGLMIADVWGLENDQIITILSYKDADEDNSGDEILANISSFSESYKALQNTGSLMKVKVIDENFTVQVKEPNSVSLKRKHKTVAINNFITRFNSCNSFKCHKRASSDTPVLPVFLDSAEILSNDVDYLKWIEMIIDWYLPPKIKWLVYEKNDNANEVLIKQVLSRLSENGISQIKKIDFEAAKSEVVGDESVVIVMPVTGSGQALLKLNRNLRISGHKGNRFFISPFVVANSQASFQQFQNSLVYGPNTMKYMYFFWRHVYIGHSDGETTWDKELGVIERFDTDFWRSRAQKLRDYQHGIDGEIGISSTNEIGHLDFTPDFAFWGKYEPDKINPEAVYVTISSILQELREKQYLDSDRDSLFSHVYQHSVIAPDNFTRYTDGLLQSCLWRAANVSELDYRGAPDLSAEFANILERLIEESARGHMNAAVDLLMGVAIGHIRLVAEVLQVLIDKAKDYYNKDDDRRLLVDFIEENYLTSKSNDSQSTMIVL